MQYVGMDIYLALNHQSYMAKARSPIYSSIMSGWEKNTPILETVLAFLRQKCRF